MDAEGTALADETIQKQRCFLRQPVVIDEELLELIDNQQDTWVRRLGIGFTYILDVGDA